MSKVIWFVVTLSGAELSRKRCFRSNYSRCSSHLPNTSAQCKRRSMRQFHQHRWTFPPINRIFRWLMDTSWRFINGPYLREWFRRQTRMGHRRNLLLRLLSRSQHLPERSNNLWSFLRQCSLQTTICTRHSLMQKLTSISKFKVWDDPPWIRRN